MGDCYAENVSRSSLGLLADWSIGLLKTVVDASISVGQFLRHSFLSFFVYCELV